MKLGEFIENYVEQNTLIRLLYKIKGGHEVVLDDWNDVSMEHEVLKGKGKFAEFINNEVYGVTDVLVDGSYSEAVNIVIKKMDVPYQRRFKIDKIKKTI